jgi:CRP-like cAMP-binding protein
MREVRFEAGETIFAEGDPSEHCYRIRSGSVEIRLRVPGVMKRGRSETIATCGPGELIGEMSVIDAAPRSATAVAVAPTVCETFTADEILNLLEHDPQEALNYVRTLIRRVRSSNRKISWSAGRSG